MAYEQRDNSGSLFKNDKGENPKSPDYKGKAMVNGKMVDMSAWLQTSEKGVKYMSLKFQEPFKKQEGPKPPKIPITGECSDSEVPF